jgi:hypothetical protein
MPVRDVEYARQVWTAQLTVLGTVLKAVKLTALSFAPSVNEIGLRTKENLFERLENPVKSREVYTRSTIEWILLISSRLP